MSGRYLLDTNIVIDLFNGVKPVVSWLTDERIIFVPSIVVGELYFGVYKSARSEKNIRILEDFIVAASLQHRCLILLRRPPNTMDALRPD